MGGRRGRPALTHPDLARVWAKTGTDLRVPAPGQAKKVAMPGSCDHVTRRLVVHTSWNKRSSDFVAHFEQPGHFQQDLKFSRPLCASRITRPWIAARFQSGAICSGVNVRLRTWCPSLTVPLTQQGADPCRRSPACCFSSHEAESFRYNLMV